MLTKRIIACLDVYEGQVVKGTRFRNHETLGEIVEFAARYAEQGIDELVLYDIAASPDGRLVDRAWIERVARVIDIPFCVAGGISSVADAGAVLAAGADKVSINSPALARPALIDELARTFGTQCVVVGMDSAYAEGDWRIWSKTGRPETAKQTPRTTVAWIDEVQKRGAGEIVLNCISQDGGGKGFDLIQLQAMRPHCQVPLVASGGAGSAPHFLDAFQQAGVDAALAAGAFHRGELAIGALKKELAAAGLNIRLLG